MSVNNEDLTNGMSDEEFSEYWAGAEASEVESRIVFFADEFKEHDYFGFTVYRDNRYVISVHFEGMVKTCTFYSAADTLQFITTYSSLYVGFPEVYEKIVQFLKA